MCRIPPEIGSYSTTFYTIREVFVLHYISFLSQKSDDELQIVEGYRQDIKSICNTFWLFGFDIRIYSDLTIEKLIETVDDLSKESIFKNYSSLVVWILSSEDLATVYGEDGLNVSKLQWTFRTENCPHLEDKPKIFFIQGHHKHRGTTQYKSIIHFYSVSIF